MLETMTVVLVFVWMFGLLTGAALGGPIHLLLVFVALVVLNKELRDRRRGRRLALAARLPA